MKKHVFYGVLLVPIICAGVISSVRAQGSLPPTSPQPLSLFSTVENRGLGQAVVAANTVLSVMPQQVGMVEVRKGQGTPIHLVLARPMADTQGQSVVPAGTPVVGQLQRLDKKRAQLVISGVLINNRVMPIQATSVQMLPIISVPRFGGQQSSIWNNSLTIDVASTGVGALVRSFGTFDSGNQASDIVRGLTSIAHLALSSRPPKARLVQINSGQPYLMKVRQTIALPLSRDRFAIASQPPFATPQYPFPSQSVADTSYPQGNPYPQAYPANIGVNATPTSVAPAFANSPSPNPSSLSGLSPNTQYPGLHQAGFSKAHTGLQSPNPPYPGPGSGAITYPATGTIAPQTAYPSQTGVSPFGHPAQQTVPSQPQNSFASLLMPLSQASSPSVPPSFQPESWQGR